MFRGLQNQAANKNTNSSSDSDDSDSDSDSSSPKWLIMKKFSEKVK